MSEQTEYTYWNPEPGEVITGKLINVVRIQSKYDAPDGSPRFYPILELETSSGAVSVSAQASVLLNELEKRKPKIGEELSITYLGKKPRKDGKGQDYHAYRVLGGTDPNAWEWGSGDGSGIQTVDGSGYARRVEPDVPIDMADFNNARANNELPGAPKPEQPKGEQFGDVPF